MPSNKKHHYVPRFYLKLFSQNELSINPFNIHAGKTIIDGQLKNQCYKDNFYGITPDVEQALGNIEGTCSRVLKNMVQTRTLPKRESKEHLSIGCIQS